MTTCGESIGRHLPGAIKLMIKQLEMPWQSRALVILDPRAQNYQTPEAFEHAVRGAASSLAHLFRHGYSPSLWIGEPTVTQVTSSQRMPLRWSSWQR